MLFSVFTSLIFGCWVYQRFVYDFLYNTAGIGWFWQFVSDKKHLLGLAFLVFGYSMIKSAGRWMQEKQLVFWYSCWCFYVLLMLSFGETYNPFNNVDSLSGSSQKWGRITLFFCSYFLLFFAVKFCVWCLSFGRWASSLYLSVLFSYRLGYWQTVRTKKKPLLEMLVQGTKGALLLFYICTGLFLKLEPHRKKMVASDKYQNMTKKLSGWSRFFIMVREELAYIAGFIFVILATLTGLEDSWTASTWIVFSGLYFIIPGVVAAFGCERVGKNLDYLREKHPLLWNTTSFCLFVWFAGTFAAACNVPGQWNLFWLWYLLAGTVVAYRYYQKVKLLVMAATLPMPNDK